MRNSIVLFSILIAGLVTGCIPTYQLPQNVLSASVNVEEVMNPEMFVGEELYRLPVNKSKYTRVPTGNRIKIGNNYFKAESSEKEFCFPFISFIPNPTYEYYLDFYLKQNDCYISALRRPVGSTKPYALDPTAKGE